MTPLPTSPSLRLLPGGKWLFLGFLIVYVTLIGWFFSQGWNALLLIFGSYFVMAAIIDVQLIVLRIRRRRAILLLVLDSAALSLVFLRPEKLAMLAAFGAVLALMALRIVILHLTKVRSAATADV
jgi:hypothetical protein